MGLDGSCMHLGEDGWRETMVGTLGFYGADDERLHTISLGAMPEYGKATFLERLAREVERAKAELPGARYVGIADGGHALVHLDHMDARPRDVFTGQGAQHEPGSVAAADGHEESAPRGYGRPSLRSHDRGSLAGDRIDIGKDFDLHEDLSDPHQPVTRGFCQPPGGETC